jgi:polyphosphate kinase
MEAPRQAFTRLLNALDTLVEQERNTVLAGDFAAVEDIQRRADPLIERLRSLGVDASDELARARVAGLLARRQHNIELIEAQLATARDELFAVQESTRRVACIAPAYGRARSAPPPNAPRFRAAG